MDRALLERMIGAIALVLLLVIVAPALLDGSRESSSDRLSNAQDDQNVRTEIIVLNEPRDPEALQESKSAAEPLQPGVVVAGRLAPAAKADESSVAAVPAVTQPETQVNNPAPAPAPARVVVATPTTSPSTETDGNESASVSRPVAGDSKISKSLPEKSQRKLAAADTVKAAGFAVQLGSFGQAANAQKYAAELNAKGFAAFVRSGSTGTGEIHRVYAGPRPSRDAAQQLAAVLGNAGYRGIVVDLSAGNGTP
jgi:cell division septation protein DedD